MKIALTTRTPRLTILRCIFSTVATSNSTPNTKTCVKVAIFPWQTRATSQTSKLSGVNLKLGPVIIRRTSRWVSRGNVLVSRELALEYLIVMSLLWFRILELYWTLGFVCPGAVRFYSKTLVACNLSLVTRVRPSQVSMKFKTFDEVSFYLTIIFNAWTF